MQYKFQSERMHRTVDSVIQFLPADARTKVLDGGVYLCTDDTTASKAAGGGVHSPACAQRGPHGVVVYIDNVATFKMRGDEIAAILAHEFAHAVLGHCGYAQKAMTPELEERNEIAADILVGKWGFRRLIKERVMERGKF